jgi:hypothetical protein
MRRKSKTIQRGTFPRERFLEPSVSLKEGFVRQRSVLTVEALLWGIGISCWLEKAQQMAAHESPRMTKLYDRQSDVVSLDKVEKVAF